MLERVHHSYMLKHIREETEWLNFWWAKANKDYTERYLLIGDSVSRKYRGDLERVLGMPVDYLGTSSLIFDELFIQEIEGFFNWGGINLYRAIQVQIGIHGIHEINTELNDDFYAVYEEQYRNLIEYLLEKTSRLVLASATPIINRYWNFSNQYLAFIFGNLHPLCIEHINEQEDKELIVRNTIVRNLAQEYGLIFNDLYSYMKNKGKKFRHIDDVHYGSRGNFFMARKVAEYFLDN